MPSNKKKKENPKSPTTTDNNTTHNNNSSQKPSDEKLWRKCVRCDNIIYEKELKENFFICPKCQGYFRMSTTERLELLTDEFKIFNDKECILYSCDPLHFPGYKEKLTKLPPSDGVITGHATIGTHKVILAIMDFEVMGGSMGSVVGEKITRAIESAHKEKMPLIIISASGGARMQEGVISLMQMAKTTSALARLHSECIPFISVLTDPTTGGVSASYAMLGDINIAEQGALIGFAGPRVIEETIKQKLPEGFQRSEFLLEHGMVDIVTERKDLKNTIISILDIINSDHKTHNK